MEKKIKLVFIYDTHLSTRWLQNFCLDDLQSIFDVEYWDCSSIVDIEYKTNTVIFRPYVAEINCLDGLKKNLDRLPNDTLIINGIHKSKEDYEIHKLISSYFHDDIVIKCFSADDITMPESSFLVRLRKLFAGHLVERIRKKIQTMIYINKYNSMYSDHVISSLRSNENHFRINHPDYERYVHSLCESKEYENERYILYIDNQFPYHNDIVMRDWDKDIDILASKFYDSLNLFFEKIEEEYDCEVVIAGHPVAIYKKNPFNGRRIIFDKTADLVKYSIAVCVHTSNAFSYVVLYDKPVALLYNEAYKEIKNEYNRLRIEADRLNLPLVNTDEGLGGKESSVFTKLSENVSDEYKDKYLIASHEKCNFELFTKYFEAIYAQINEKQNS